PAVVESPDGRAAAAFFDRTHRQLKYAVRRSEGWEVSVVERDVTYRQRTGDPGNHGDVQLAFDSQGWPHLVYEPTNRRLRYATRRDDGWRVRPIDGNDRRPDEVAIDVDVDDRVHIVHGSRQSNRLEYARFDGDRWTREELSIGSSNKVLAVEPSGTPHLIHTEVDDGRRLGYAVRKNGGWQRRSLPTRGYANIRVGDVQIDAELHLHVVWHGRPEGAGESSVFYATNASGEWQRERVVTVNAAKAVSVGRTVDGRPQVVFAGNPRSGAEWQVGYAVRTEGTWEITRPVEEIPDTYRNTGRLQRYRIRDRSDLAQDGTTGDLVRGSPLRQLQLGEPYRRRMACRDARPPDADHRPPRPCAAG
ncbi:MAG: hypothetical protein ABEN55_10535, partial [Bradymonadaceae bacterium]